MSDRLFGDREKALEDEFFHRREKQLLEKLRAENKARETKEGLAEASGIKDEKVLARAVELGVTPESFFAVSLIPLVLVAWADRTMEPSEKSAILKAAEDQGIRSGSAAQALLDAWLSQQPGAGLFDAWAGYIKVLKENMSGEELSVLKSGVMDRAKDVAKAAGGLAGIGAVSSQEKEVLAKLEQVFA